jgi:hypothetical protein
MMLSLMLLILPAVAPPSPPVAFALPDGAGKVHRLAGPAVVVFLACDCPLAQRYAPRLCHLAGVYRHRGIQFLAIAAREETADDVERFRATPLQGAFPVLRPVVHHCNLFLQPPGVRDPEALMEVGTLGSYCLTMMAQGTPPLVLTGGRAKRIPAGWKLVFVLHYQTVGTEQTDQTSLGLRFARSADVTAEVATKLQYDPGLRIPPGAARHEVVKEWTAPADVWQHRYELAEPLRVKKGGRLRCTAVYDNSADNPNNPDPEAEVRVGQQSWEEMFNGYFDVCLAEPRRPSGWGLWVVLGLAIGGCAAVLVRRRPGA